MINRKRVQIRLVDQDNNPINNDYITVDLPYSVIPNNWHGYAGIQNSLYLLLYRNIKHGHLDLMFEPLEGAPF